MDATDVSQIERTIETEVNECQYHDVAYTPLGTCEIIDNDVNSWGIHSRPCGLSFIKTSSSSNQNK
jgi:hypothetical protein